MRQIRRKLWALPALLLALTAYSAEPVIVDPVAPDNLFPQIKLTTSHGEITVELDRRRAPITVNNFLRYVVSGRYDNTVFHRIVTDFVVQGGGYQRDMTPVESYDTIYNESGNGLANSTGSIAMARYSDPHTASSQFYFNLKDNQALNPNPRRWGYTVFGQIVEGLEVVQQMSTVKTGFSEVLDATDVPIEPVVLVKAELVP